MSGSFPSRLDRPAALREIRELLAYRPDPSKFSSTRKYEEAAEVWIDLRSGWTDEELAKSNDQRLRQLRARLRKKTTR